VTRSVTSPPSIDALRKVHSITSSAVVNIVGGTFKPGAFAAIVSRPPSPSTLVVHRGSHLQASDMEAEPQYAKISISYLRRCIEVRYVRKNDVEAL
jgi:hypothetical protein